MDVKSGAGYENIDFIEMTHVRVLRHILPVKKGTDSNKSSPSRRKIHSILKKKFIV